MRPVRVPVPALAAVGSTATLRHVYTHFCHEDFGDALLVRPGLDRRIEVEGRVFWRLIVAASAPQDRGRALAREDAYDLIVMAGRRNDSVAMLLAEASRLGVQVFVGMPAAPMHPKYPWDPWREAMPTFLELARRVLEDYAQRYGALASFEGVYQSVEIPVAEGYCRTRARYAASATLHTHVKSRLRIRHHVSRQDSFYVGSQAK